MELSEQTARVPTEKGNQRVAAILESAKNILVKKGFSALSFRNIAIGANIAVGNLQYYYPSKDQLMIDLAGYIYDRWDVRFRKTVPVSLSTPRDIFLYSIRYMIQENKRTRTVNLLTEMWALANHSASVAKMLDAFYVKMRAYIKELILNAKPDIDPAQCEIRAALIIAQIEGMMILIGPKRLRHEELDGIEEAALEQIEKIAFGRRR